LQSAYPLEQTNEHAPDTQSLVALAAAGHALPQALQLRLSVCVFAQ